jgi:hypothetical protein
MELKLKMFSLACAGSFQKSPKLHLTQKIINKQSVLALKWSFEKSPNLYSIVEIKNTSFLRGTGILKILQIFALDSRN